ncbi:oxidoreductase [Leucobacter weissii]|uniref:Oxidoreductase n=1 Tax=Leucobacter weissii TaxID=1983706 RepID=A0A939MJF0_9MICO|nr:oxidoreductase [Leucobacter weissii]
MIRQSLSVVGAALGRLPMYRVASLALGALVVVSFALSFAGVLYYTPAELAALLGISVLGTVLVSRLAALVWRAETHDESSLITGLLLFFILKPGVEPLDLAAAVLGAAVAGLSKFLLAWRGRHLFNPAALGAFVVSASGVGAGYWWIGSSDLVWFVVPIAAIVVIRLGQVLLASLAAAAGLAVYTLSAVSWGSTAPQALQTGIASTALVFFAAFMVTEPLTLPPRRGQRIAVALVTGALFAAPIPLGALFMSPQLALLIGNALGFVLARRRGIRLALREARRGRDGTVELRFAAQRPLRYRAGQAIELHVPGVSPFAPRGQRRVFSLVSAPSDSREVRVAFRLPARPSAAKRALAELPVGAEVRATGVWGDFAPPRDARRGVVMVAGGIGLTPFLSWLREARSEGGERDAVLVLAASAPDANPFREELAELPARVILAGGENAPASLGPREEWAGPGRITGERIAELVPDLAQRDAFVSGPPRFVAELRGGLRRRSRRVRTDAFAGY